jgi:predicted RNase H-like HicB family nuclease
MMKPTNEEYLSSVSVLLHRDGDAWVAQCLEFDLAAQAPTKEEVKRRFMRTLTQQIVADLLDDNTPLSKLPQAPSRYFEDSVTSMTSGPELPVFVPADLTKDKGRVSVRAQFLEPQPSP